MELIQSKEDLFEFLRFRRVYGYSFHEKRLSDTCTRKTVVLWDEDQDTRIYSFLRDSKASRILLAYEHEGGLTVITAGGVIIEGGRDDVQVEEDVWCLDQIKTQLSQDEIVKGLEEYGIKHKIVPVPERKLTKKQAWRLKKMGHSKEEIAEMTFEDARKKIGEWFSLNRKGKNE